MTQTFTAAGDFTGCDAPEGRQKAQWALKMAAESVKPVGGECHVVALWRLNGLERVPTGAECGTIARCVRNALGPRGIGGSKIRGGIEVRCQLGWPGAEGVTVAVSEVVPDGAAS